MKTILETTRLKLRQIKSTDADFIHKLYNDVMFIKYIGFRGITSLQKAEEYIEQNIQFSYNSNGFGLYLVELKKTSKAIGICGLVKRKGLVETDIGFAFLPNSRGKGYAYEAASAVIVYAKDVLNISKIVGITDPENMSSINVLKKLGLVYEKNIVLPGDNKEIMLFS